LIDPIDFMALYRRRQQQTQAGLRAQGEPVPDPIRGDGAPS
jgi:hypothetical protein